MVRPKWLRPSGQGGAVTREPGGSRLPWLAGGQVAANGGHVLVKLGGRGHITGGYAVQDCLPDFVGQPEGHGRQWDR